MTDLNTEDLWYRTARAEHDLWRKLTMRLVMAKAITTEDLEAPVKAGGTNGQRLLNLLREWGESRATLALAMAAHKMAAHKKGNPG